MAAARHCPRERPTRLRRFTATTIIVLLALPALAACGDESSTGPPPATPATPAPSEDASASAATDGASLFAADCAACHGPKGAGGRGPSISDRTDTAAVADTIRRGGSSMPAFGDTLQDDQIEAIAAYVTGGL